MLNDWQIYLISVLNTQKKKKAKSELNPDTSRESVL